MIFLASSLDKNIKCQKVFIFKGITTTNWIQVYNQIRQIIKKQLKKQYPNWKRLSKKQKKAISKAVLNEAVAQYDFEQDIQVPLEELIGIEEQIPMDDIMNLEEMAHFRFSNLLQQQFLMFP